MSSSKRHPSKFARQGEAAFTSSQAFGSDWSTDRETVDTALFAANCQSRDAKHLRSS